MYDKIKIIADLNTEFDVTRLNDAKTIAIHQTGEFYTSGGFKGLRLSVRPYQITVTGSLAKYYFGNNIQTLTRTQTQEAIEQMSNDLGVPLYDAKVTELEFGANFTMSHPVQVYMKQMVDCPRLQPVIRDHTLYFEGKCKDNKKPKQFVFYDKGREAIDTGTTSNQNVKNLLRFEIRYKGRLPYQLDCPEVKASTLYDKNFYCQMVGRYKNAYNSISKHGGLCLNINGKIRNPKEALPVALSLKYKDSTITDNEVINLLKKYEIFKDPKYYTRLKNMMKRMTTDVRVTKTDKLIRELNEKIEDFCSQQMSS